MSLTPGTTLWFARHELTLAWREFAGMLTGGRRTRGIAIVVTIAIAALMLHLLAIGLVSPWVAAGIGPEKPTLLLVSGFGMLFFSVMLSQGLESVTRAYYARSDLDLILSSPASARRLFAVRTAAVAGATMLLACLLASPLIDALWLLDGPRWLAAYGVLAALGAVSAAIGILITIALFRLVGPKRTRLASQIVAAVIGAGFVIGVQAAAILYYGSYSRLTIFQSDDVIAGAPEPASPLWIPAHAAMGDPPALLLMLAAGLGTLLVVIALTASSYGRHAISATGVGEARTRRGSAAARFRSASVRQTLRAKEWKLLARDPWLLSQTLMQILYLLPPALLLWVNFGETSGAHVVVVPVLVMACGQLAGGLAWLAISGEDAHDLVATAPVAPRTVLIAKIEAVTVVVAVILAPLLALMALDNPTAAAIAGICGALAAASATAIQLWFRTIARRAMFRRRQVASRAATISEAFVSILWAGTGAVWAAGSWLAGVVAILAVLVLGFARLIAPRHH